MPYRIARKEHRLSTAGGVATIVLALMAFLHLQVNSQAQSSSHPPPTGRVKGTAFAFKTDGVILGLGLIFVGHQVERRVVTNEAGEYQIDLPAGIYRVEIDNTYSYYFPYRRAAFRIQPDTVTMINIVPVQPHIVSINMVPPGNIKIPPEYYDEGLPRKYESYWLPHRPDPQLDLVICFLDRRKRKEVIKYNKAIASYDVMALYADTIYFDRKASRLIAEGNVIVEDGKQRIKAHRIVTKFVSGVSEIISLEKK